MKKLIGFLTGVVFIAMGLLPMAAQAVVDLEASPVVPAKFAKELINPTPTTTSLTNAANAMDVTAKVGFGIAAASSKYVRYDLDSSALFGAGPLYTVLTTNGNVVAGGTGAAYVIFQVTAATTILDTSVGTMSCGVYTVTGTTAVNVTYRLFSTDVDAVNKTNALATKTGSLITYPSGLDAKSTAVTTNVIDVLSASKSFVSTFASDKLHTRIASVGVAPTTGVLKLAGTAVALSDLVGASDVLILTGDFSAASSGGAYDAAAKARVYIATDDTCATTSKAADALTATEARFILAQAGLTASKNICMKAEGNNAIVPVTFSGLYDTNAGKAANVSLPDLSTLTKNSSTLQTPWFPWSNTVNNRVVLTNMSSSAITFSVTVYSQPGVTITYKTPNSFTLAPNEVKLFKVTDLVTLTAPPSTPMNSSLQLNFMGAATSIQGVFQYTKPDTGMFVSTPLLETY